VDEHLNFVLKDHLSLNCNQVLLVRADYAFAQLHFLKLTFHFASMILKKLLLLQKTLQRPSPFIGYLLKLSVNKPSLLMTCLVIFLNSPVIKTCKEKSDSEDENLICMRKGENFFCFYKYGSRRAKTCL
jgi:hypothetical protein